MEINSTRGLLIMHMLIILACFAVRNYAAPSDIDCLRSIRDSLVDPENLLSTWDFNNDTEGFICQFIGIECWFPYESKVMNIDLSGMGLRGPFPTSLQNCINLTRLNLSSNHLTGRIPSNVADVLPSVETLDLSSNNLSGPIPISFCNISYINVLRLDNNQLSGEIPYKLSLLDRMNDFSVANNRLSGQVPIFRDPSISVDSYAGNLGLCGDPLPPCNINESNHHNLFYTGLAVGFPFSTLITLLLIYSVPRSSMKNMRDFLPMVKNINGRKQNSIPKSSHILLTKPNNTEESKIATMEKYVRRLSLEELKLATNDFDIKNVIGFGNMGLMYKGVLTDGMMLAVKRLHNFESFEEEFLLELEILRRPRLINLVPLLGFCFEMDKKFLVYKYMSNGTLHQWLHSKPRVEGMKMGWSLRLRIAIGIARGLAWLHHNKVLRVAHLKISSKSILLDNKFEPKISNFGYSNVLMNTRGALSSDCTFVNPHSSHSSYEEDVYSFGILLLELVSGREWPSEETNSSVRDTVFGEEFSMIDECLMGQGFNDDIYETLRIAKKCIQSHKDGTTSMLEVYLSFVPLEYQETKFLTIYLWI